MTRTKEKTRCFGLDLIRFIAILFIVLLHSFLKGNYYVASMSGLKMFLLTFVKWTTFICVPLFMILTGYLKSNKKVNKEHYSKIVPILIVYVAISVITILFKIFYCHNTNYYDLLIGIFNFTTVNYAWYIEMYIGLFLLIPFLNILYKNIGSKRNKKILLLTLIFLTSFPQTMAMLGIDKYSFDLFPAWWGGMYPIMYYFIGSYIREYKINIKKIVNVGLILATLFLQTFISYYLCQKGDYADHLLFDHNCFPTVIVTTLVFILLYDISIRGHIIKNTIAKISSLAFSIYLFSYIFDTISINIFKNILKTFNGNIFSLLIISPLVFILSIVASLILKWIIKLFGMLINYIVVKHKEKYHIVH